MNVSQAKEVTKENIGHSQIQAKELWLGITTAGTQVPSPWGQHQLLPKDNETLFLLQQVMNGAMNTGNIASL